MRSTDSPTRELIEAAIVASRAAFRHVGSENKFAVDRAAVDGECEGAVTQSGGAVDIERAGIECGASHEIISGEGERACSVFGEGVARTVDIVNRSTDDCGAAGDIKSSGGNASNVDTARDGIVSR